MRSRGSSARLSGEGRRTVAGCDACGFLDVDEDLPLLPTAPLPGLRADPSLPPVGPEEDGPSNPLKDSPRITFQTTVPNNLAPHREDLGVRELHNTRFNLPGDVYKW